MNDKEYQLSDSPCCTSPNLDDAGFSSNNHDLALLAKALGHPARVKILQLLIARNECICGEFCLELPLAQSTISQHLKVLKEAGLIKGEVDGLRVCYCVDRNRLELLKKLIAAL